MIPWRGGRRILISVFFLDSLLGFDATAQISPGELAAPHANLEGIRNCTQCHELGGGPSAGKCLDCHKEIGQRLAEKAGYHFLVVVGEKQPCFKCHSDHNGRNFNMIHWPDSETKFDHRLAGFLLLGKHGNAGCRDCHKPDKIAADPRKLNPAIDLKRTFLGLDQRCLSCHQDAHRGQLSADCLQCHDYDGWKPAAKFDHNQARFQLTGRHNSVDCGKCHPGARDVASGISFVKFRGLPFDNCTACHQDIHLGRFGNDCTTCHSTNGWKGISGQGFNHSLTRFPLLGRHQFVACTQCHRPGQPRRGLAFAACSDCHRDPHRGEFAQRPDGGRCESCHSVSGFRPANFTAGDHDKSRFPLTGAHRTANCGACHRPSQTNGIDTRMTFRFADLSCSACHTDIHKGQFTVQMGSLGCASCHTTSAWKTTTFDHNKSKFPLTGRHARVACAECHKLTDIGTPAERILFKPIATNCDNCHKDIHVLQFDDQRCSKCHRPVSWFSLLFDHNRDSRYKIDGAHKDVGCAECHPREILNGQSLIRFKPIDTKCASCHGEGK